MHVFSSVVSPVPPVRLEEGRCAKALEEISGVEEQAIAQGGGK